MERLADGLSLHQFSHSLQSRMEAELEADEHLATACSFCLSQSVEVIHGMGDGLLEEDVATGVQGCRG